MRCRYLVVIANGFANNIILGGYVTQSVCANSEDGLGYKKNTIDNSSYTLAFFTYYLAICWIMNTSFKLCNLQNCFHRFFLCYTKTENEILRRKEKKRKKEKLTSAYYKYHLHDDWLFWSLQEENWSSSYIVFRSTFVITALLLGMASWWRWKVTRLSTTMVLIKVFDNDVTVISLCRPTISLMG